MFENLFGVSSAVAESTTAATAGRNAITRSINVIIKSIGHRVVMAPQENDLLTAIHSTIQNVDHI